MHLILCVVSVVLTPAKVNAPDIVCCVCGFPHQLKSMHLILCVVSVVPTSAKVNAPDIVCCVCCSHTS